jgi:hypothetical protein
MNLDGNRISNPIAQERRAQLKKAISRELTALQKKILMASSLGHQQCTYRVQPTFQFPNPSNDILPGMCQELARKNFHVYTGPLHSILVQWGTT